MSDHHTYALIEERTRELTLWLEHESPYVQFDQQHLDRGSQQQAYWHLGYVSALRDVLGLLKDETARKPDTTSSPPMADPDE